MALSSHTLSWWLSSTGDRHCRDSWTVTPPAQTEGQPRRPAPAPRRASRATALAPDWSTPAPPAMRASPSTQVSAAVAEHTCGRPRPSIQAGAITTKHKYGKKKDHRIWARAAAAGEQADTSRRRAGEREQSAATSRAGERA